MVTSIVTYLLLNNLQSHHSAELYATIITAPPLFIFSELIPKNLFFNYSDFLMLKIAPLLYGFYKFLRWCGIIAIFKYISWGLAKLTHTPVPSKGIIKSVQKHEAAAFFEDIHDESFLSSVQDDIVNRLLIVSNKTINEVMTPLKKILPVSADSDRSKVMSIIEDHDFTRLPVYKDTQDNIIGFINIYQVLCSKERVENLQSFIKPIRIIPQKTLLTDAMEIMQAEEEKMALVVRVVKGDITVPVGIITMKDLVEELFGELGSW